MIADPPLLAGASKVMVACPFQRVTPVILGAPGVVAGVTALLTLEATLSPRALVAITVKV